MALLDHYSKPMHDVHILPLMDWETMKPKSCIFGIHKCVDERSMQTKTILVWVRCPRTDGTAGLPDLKPGLTRCLLKI